MSNDDGEELRVSFNPPLYLQRQKWVLDILRREAVQSVLDIGCGEGSLLQCLTEPSQFTPPLNLPATSPFVSGPFAESHVDLHLKEIHGLDPHSPDLEFAIRATAPPIPDDMPFTGHERWRTRQARWTPLEVNLWEGGFENVNEDFKGDTIDAFVASEVIEHLSPDLLPLFAPILLGYYRPRLVLLTTPNFAYNKRFSRPGEGSSTGYLDPTGRTDRVFRHHDHKFEWTTEEWVTFCTDAASKFGYNVTIGGVGLATEPDPWQRDNILGFASQVATFKRVDSQSFKVNVDYKNSFVNARGPILRAKHVHHPHPLSLEELDRPPVIADIRQAVKDAINAHRESAMTFDSVWKYGVVSLKCAGDIATLVKAFQQENLDDQEWSIVDGEKGWYGMIVWKNFVIPDDTLESQGGSGPWQTGTDEPLNWSDGNAIEEEPHAISPRLNLVPTDDGVDQQTLLNRWQEEDYPWVTTVEKGSDVWGWDVSGDNARHAATLWTLPGNPDGAPRVEL